MLCSQGWILALAVGVLSFFSYAFIEVCKEALSSLRYGYCGSGFLVSVERCELLDGEWHVWGGGFIGFIINVSIGTCFATASSWLCWRLAPAASGSGIPEVKTVLNGFVLSDVLTFRTLTVKLIGLLLAVASGMSLGHEGPMVHVGVCWAHILYMRLPYFRQNEARKRELLSAGAAAGISSAFGTPIGGVLFSLEEVSSQFPSSTLLLAFMASVAAMLVTALVNLTNDGHLTLYQVTYTATFHTSEYLVFAVLGMVGGLVGAVFNALNVRWNAFRASPAYRDRIHPVAEVSFVAFVTLVTSWPLRLTRPLNALAIHALFDTCSARGTRKDMLQAELGLCDADGWKLKHPDLMLKLGLAAFLRFVQTVFTIGITCPAGLFVPSMYIGACLGRFVGGLLKAIDAGGFLFPADIDPGVYSMVGAAAVLGGISRMTISLVVMMLELTGGTDYVVAFMLAVLSAKFVGDAFNEGIYDLQIVLKGYPFLHESVGKSVTECCRDAMEVNLAVVDQSGDLGIAALRSRLLGNATTFRGFPVVDGPRFVGYVRRHLLEALLEETEARAGAGADLRKEDLERCVDTTVVRMVPEAPLAQAHQIFKQLGCQHIFVVGPCNADTSLDDQCMDSLLGMLSKKSFLRFVTERTKDAKGQRRLRIPRMLRRRNLRQDRKEQGPNGERSLIRESSPSGSSLAVLEIAQRASPMAQLDETVAEDDSSSNEDDAGDLVEDPDKRS